MTTEHDSTMELLTTNELAKMLKVSKKTVLCSCNTLTNSLL